MRFLRICIALTLLWSVSTYARSKKNFAPAQQRATSTNYNGWNNSLVLSGSSLRAVVIPDLGGRIAEYSLDGQNILLPPPPAGLPLSSNTKINPGGYQCDLGPEFRGIPSHDLLWNGTYKATISSDVGVKVTSPTDPNLGVQIEKDVFVEPESGDLGLTQRLRNVSDKEVSFSLWDRTSCPSGGFAVFKLKKKSRFPARWALRRTVQGKEMYDGDKPSSPNVQVMDGFLIARCDGEATKIGADIEEGWIAYVRGNYLLVKYFPISSKGVYSNAGNTVELFFSNTSAELQPLSPEVRLKKGETYEFPERWTLTELPSRVSIFKEVRDIAKKIPDSPF